MLGSYFKGNVVTAGLASSVFEKPINIARGAEFGRPLLTKDIEIFDQGDEVIPLTVRQDLVRNLVVLEHELAGSQTDGTRIVPLGGLHYEISGHRPRQFCDICSIPNSMCRGLTVIPDFILDHYFERRAFCIGRDIHGMVSAENIGAQLPFSSFFGTPNQTLSGPPQSKREQNQKRVGDLQLMSEDRPIFGSLIASIGTVAAASGIYRISRAAGVLIGFYGFAGLLFGFDIWSLIEWRLRGQ